MEMRVAQTASRAAAVFPPLKLREKATFATGDMVEGGINYALSTFLLFYLTGVCGLSGSLAGLALSLTLLVDAVMDPLIGYVSDNTRARLGRRHPFLLGAAIPLALSVALLFSIPEGLKGAALFAYVVAILLVQRVVHSGFLLPYAAMVSELSRDYRERSSVTMFRQLFNNFGLLITLSLGFGLFLKGDAALVDRHAYAAYGWAIGGVVLVLMLTCGLGTLPMRFRLQANPHAQAPSPAQFGRELVNAFRNRSFVILFAAIVIFWVAQGAAGALGLHAYKYFWRAPADLLQLIPAFTVGGALTGVPIAGFLLTRLEKQQVCVGGVVLYCLTQSILTVAHVLGLTPETGPGLVGVIGVLVVLQTWALCAIGVSFFSMMADCTDEHAQLFGARQEALFFAATTFSTKAAIALGSLIAGVSLDLIGFPKEIAKLGPNPVIAADTVRNLGLLVGPGAGLMAITCVLFLARYSLDPARVAKIQDELAARSRP